MAAVVGADLQALAAMGIVLVAAMVVAACPPTAVAGGMTPIADAAVLSHLEMYRTNVLMYRTMVFLARPTKVRR